MPKLRVEPWELRIPDGCPDCSRHGDMHAKTCPLFRGLLESLECDAIGVKVLGPFERVLNAAEVAYFRWKNVEADGCMMRVSRHDDHVVWSLVP